MPQLDIVTFPSQIFWLTIFFLVFYSFVSGHFVPLLHKILQTRAQKVAMGQAVSTGSSDAREAARSGSETLFVSTFDKASLGLQSCSDEAVVSQDSHLSSGDKAKVSSLAGVVGSMQARYLVSKGALFVLIKDL
jgi:hypothetical protein